MKNGEKHSVHELLYDKEYKLFFDIESYDETILYNEFVQTVLKYIRMRPTYHVASCNRYDGEKGKNKSSYHIVFDVRVSSLFNINLAAFLKKTYSYVDDTIYTRKHNMRLAGCIKTH